MKEIIKDIREKLLSNAYRKEEHVRIAIIARICQYLGWDIWDPEEFFTEYPIRLKTKEGSVDVALFHRLEGERTPDVFLELKAVGKGKVTVKKEVLLPYKDIMEAKVMITF